MNILYLNTEPTKQIFGGTYVANRNLKALQKIVGEKNVFVWYIKKTTLKSVVRSLLTLSSYGISRQEETEIIKARSQLNCDIVFIEGSLRGGLVKRLKNSCTTIIFAHNIEALLYRQRLSKERGFISYIRYLFIKYNEHKSVQFADKIITLNQRDNNYLQNIYHRSSDYILPITYPKQIVHSSSDFDVRPYCLFVGSDFFPNIEGIIWFIKNVASHINLEVRIIGSCCRNPSLMKLKLPSNVHLDGYVDDIAKYYHHARAIIVPIFSGSGMKTKTIEAMSYGKTIIGTSEAFVGIEGDFNQIGGLCNTADEFIKVLSSKEFCEYNSYTMQLFLSRYTDDSFLKGLKSALLD